METRLSLKKIIGDLSMREKYPQIASRAFGELCKRLESTFLHESKGICRNARLREADETAHDILKMALDKFFLTPQKFNVSKYASEEATTFGLVSYFKKTLLKNELRDYKNKFYGGNFGNVKCFDENRDSGVSQITETSFEESLNADQLEVLLRKRSILKDVMQKLTKEDRLIVYTAYKYHKKYIPREEYNMIIKQLGISKANFRQKKVRLCKQVKKDALDLYNANK